MPEWSVDVRVNIVDEPSVVRRIKVKAMTARHAKAKARNLIVRTAILGAFLLDPPVTGAEFTTHKEGH